MKVLKKFLRNESGAAIVEYGLALLVVAGIAVGAFGALGTTTNTNVQRTKHAWSLGRFRRLQCHLAVRRP